LIVATISARLVKELRDRTGLGMMDCKKALEEADGDIDKAIELLRKNSALKAAAKANRTAAEGLLGIRIGADARRGTMVEINVETDFAARNAKFGAFLETVTNAAFDTACDSVEALMTGDLEAERVVLVQEIGENITVGRVVTFETAGGAIHGYVHTDRRKGALVEVEGGDDSLGRDLAMHVTASAPLVVAPDQLDQTFVEKEREILVAQAASSAKTPEIAEKMVAGRLRKTLAELSLVEQPFVRDPKTKVGKLLADADARCVRLVRFDVGQAKTVG
jgi:elongation factor Ts